MSRKEAKYRGTKCLNCNTPLDISERYCHYCGQLNSTKRITLSDFIEEFFSNFYAYDSKIRNTFSYLFTKPAFVAHQIINGKRQTFANPFRLFLSISIIYFLFSSFFSPEESSIFKNKQTENNDSIKRETNFTYYSSKEIKNSSYFYKKIKILDNYYSAIEEDEEIDFKGANKKLGLTNSSDNHYLFTRAELTKDFVKNGLQSNIMKAYNEKRPFIIFLLLPFITIAFLISFGNKSYNYTDHLVFVYTVATVLFIKYFFDLLFLHLVGFPIESITAILFILYIYRSLRKFYNNSRWKTILKFVLLTFTSTIIGIPILLLTFIFVFLIT